MNYKQAFAVGLIAPGVMAVREQWETLFEGTVETVAATHPDGTTASAHLNVSFDLNDMIGETIRATVDGNTQEFEVVAYILGAYIGTIPYVGSNETDVYVAKPKTVDTTGFYVLPAGTHSVKLEREVSA